MKYIIHIPVSCLRDDKRKLTKEEVFDRYSFQVHHLIPDKSRNKSRTDYNYADPIISDMEEFADENQIDYDEMYDFAIRVAEANLERMPRISETALDTSVERTRELDTFLSDRHSRTMDELLPGGSEEILGPIRDALSSTKRVADAVVKGDVPEDFLAEIERDRDQLNISHGLFGPIARNATWRDLGQSRLGMMLKGVAMQGDVSILSQRLLSTALSMAPPQADPVAIYGQHLGAGIGAGTIPVGGAMQMGANIATANAEMAWAAKLSAANMQMDMYQTELAYKMHRESLSAAKSNAMWSGLTKLAGAGIGFMVGGPAGAAAGYSAGSMLGGGQTDGGYYTESMSTEVDPGWM